MHIKGLVSESMPMPRYKPNFVHAFFVNGEEGKKQGGIS